MALHKEHSLKSGITLSYWIIQEFSADRESKKFNISAAPYVSKQIRDNGGVPVLSEKIVIRVEDIEYPAGSEWKNIMHYTEYFSPEALTNKDIYAVMYNYLKSNIDFFKDAEDI